MRTILSLLLSLALGASLGAVNPSQDQRVDGTSADYQSIRALQQRSNPYAAALPEAGAAKAEVMLALAETATRAAEGHAESLKSRDYDALYALLQKYREDLKAMGLKQSDLENQLVALKLHEKELEEKINALSLFNLDGMKIYGRQSFTFDDLLMTGPGTPTTKPAASAGNAFRYRTASLETDLSFTATRGPVSGLAELNYKYFIGSPWPGFDYFGVRQMRAEVRLPVVAQVGDVDLQWTPLTFWRNDDVDPFDVEPFTARQNRLLEDLSLDTQSHALRMRGLRLLSDVVLFESQVIHLQGVFSGLGYPGGIAYYTGTYPLTGTFPYLNNILINGSYNTYMMGWQADYEASKAFDLAYSGNIIYDNTDSASAAYTLASQPAPGMAGQKVRGYNSQVHSGQLKSSLFDGVLKLRGEYAESLYSNPNDPVLFKSPTAGASGYLTGSAATFEAEINAGWLQLKGKWHQVDSSFISAQAQGRTNDSSNSNYGPFLTETDRYNPQTGLFFDNYLGLPNSGESQVNRIMLPPQLQKASVAAGPGTAFTVTPGAYFFNYLLPYNSALDASSPYGDATPNRMGYGGEASLKLFDGALIPLALGDVSSESTAKLSGNPHPAETFTTFGGGGTLDFKPWLGWPLKLNGGWKGQTVADGALVNFSSSQYSAGLQWRYPESTLWYLGSKHINYSGTLAIPLYGAYQDPLTGGLVSGSLAAVSGNFKYDQSYDILSLGVRHMLTATSDIELNYSSQVFWDNLAEQAGSFTHYEMDQTFMKFNLRF